MLPTSISGYCTWRQSGKPDRTRPNDAPADYIEAIFNRSRRHSMLGYSSPIRLFDI